MSITLKTDEKGIKIFRKDKTSQAGKPYTTYCIKVSSKQMDDSWASAFIDVAFKKGVSVNDKAVINIKNSFFTVNSYNGTSKLRLMITEFDVIENGEDSQPAPVVTGTEDFMSIPDNVAEELDNLFG